MKLLVGLGNPGKKYTRNRHNVGFRVNDAIWAKHGGSPWRTRFNGEFTEIRVGTEKCLLLKPQTYMNESGRAVGAAMQFFKLNLEDIIIFYDEIDLVPGKLRIKTGGGTAGHNGLRSISAQIGNDYVRVRIGVGRPAQKHQVANYVLHDFAKSDEEWLEPLIDALASATDKILAGDYASVMNETALAAKAALGEDEKKTGSDKQKAKTTSDNKPSKTTKPKTTGKSGEPGKPGGALADKLKSWLKDTND